MEYWRTKAGGVLKNENVELHPGSFCKKIRGGEKRSAQAEYQTSRSQVRSRLFVVAKMDVATIDKTKTGGGGKEGRVIFSKQQEVYS